MVHGRDRGRAQAVADEIATAGGTAVLALGDLMTADGLEAVIAAAGQSFGGIDILVNNAGGSDSGTASGWFETPPEDWADSYHQNTLPVVGLAQAFVPAMRECGWGGSSRSRRASLSRPMPSSAPMVRPMAALTI